MEDTVKLASMVSTVSPQQKDFIRLFLYGFLQKAGIIILKYNSGGTILQGGQENLM